MRPYYCNLYSDVILSIKPCSSKASKLKLWDFKNMFGLDCLFYLFSDLVTWESPFARAHVILQEEIAFTTTSNVCKSSVPPYEREHTSTMTTRITRFASSAFPTKLSAAHAVTEICCYEKEGLAASSAALSLVQATRESRPADLQQLPAHTYAANAEGESCSQPWGGGFPQLVFSFGVKSSCDKSCRV